MGDVWLLGADVEDWSVQCAVCFDDGGYGWTSDCLQWWWGRRYFQRPKRMGKARHARGHSPIWICRKERSMHRLTVKWSALWLTLLSQE